MAKLKKFEKPVLTVNDIAKLGEDYDALSAQIKELTARKTELSNLIKEGAEKYGVKDDKGSFYLESDSFILGKVAKKTMKLDQDKAREVLESKGMGDVLDSVTVITVNEDRLEQAVQDKRITLDEVKDFTNTKVEYSVSVKAKEVIPEIEQTNLKVARKK